MDASFFFSSIIQYIMWWSQHFLPSGFSNPCYVDLLSRRSTKWGKGEQRKWTQISKPLFDWFNPHWLLIMKRNLDTRTCTQWVSVTITVGRWVYINWHSTNLSVSWWKRKPEVNLFDPQIRSPGLYGRHIIDVHFTSSVSKLTSAQQETDKTGPGVALQHILDKYV
jgi:hypothetical protein